MKKLITALLLSVMALSPLAKLAEAAPVNPGTPMVSITFDDGFASTYTNAMPLLNQRGMKGTAYITTTMIGQPGMMNWTQVKALQNTYGWEIGSHTVTHPELPTKTLAQIQSEIKTSKTTLQSQGLNVTSFASPFGAYDNRVLTESLKVYNSHRGFWDRDTLNSYPYNRAVIQDQSIESTTTVAQVQTWVNQAKTNKQWLNLVVHEVQPKLDPSYEYVVTTTNFAKMLDYIKTSGVQVVTDNHTLTKPGFNLVANPSFDQGLASGWTTDNATTVKLDVANNGSYPSSTNSIVMQGGATASHLFSSAISANSAASYQLESFVNTDTLTAGELGFYIDEYDAQGNWISGQRLGSVVFDKVTYFTTLYQPTSTAASTFKIQVDLAAKSAGKVYLDNVDMYNLTPSAQPSVTPTPSPTSTPTPTVTPTPAVTPTPVATSKTNLVAKSLTLTDSRGMTKTAFAPNEAIYVKTLLGSNGSAQVPAGITTEVYANQPLAVAAGTKDAPEFAINHTGYWAALAGSYTYGSYTGGSRIEQFAGTVRSFKQSTPGTYTARVYVDALNANGESNESDNQITATYTITGTVPTPTVTPTPKPTVTPTPAPVVSLVANGSFEQLVSGWATSWTKDGTGFAIDTTSKGNNGTNSLTLKTSATASHVFSSAIAIDPTASYTWSQRISAAYVSGEVGYYIDEYDANGNWISGQWKGNIVGSTSGDIQISYTPTSAQVKTVQLQYYAIAGTTMTLYVDSVSFAKK